MITIEKERKKILEKIGISIITSVIIFIFLSSITFKEISVSFLIFRSLINPIAIFIGFSSFFGFHVLEFFRNLINEIKQIKFKDLIFFLKYVFIYQGIIILMTNLNVVQEVNKGTSKFLDIYISITMILFVLFEEYIFRYLLQTKLSKVCNDYGILFMSIVFGFFHYGKFLSGFLFGIVLGIIYILTDNIAYTVIIHYFLNSTLSLKIIIFFQNIFMGTQIELYEINKTTGVVSILLGVILIFIQILSKCDYAYCTNQSEKQILKKLINQIKYLPELIKTFPINLVLFFRFFIFIQKFI